jgi:uncharacterized protein (DUF305 family)
MRKALVTAMLAIAAIATAAHAQHSGHQPQPSHGQHGAKAKSAPKIKGADTPSSRAFEEANSKMHAGMAITYSGNADRDFIAGMIAHHQGAVDMANIVIKYGKNPEVRKLAQEIVAAQEKEIAWMKEWQAKNAK